MPTLDGAVVLVTGANGGLGTRFVHQALERGAAKVYAAARNPRNWGDDRIVLDVTSPESIAATAYDGIEAGSYEILADELSGRVKAGRAAPVEALYPQLAGARG